MCYDRYMPDPTIPSQIDARVDVTGPWLSGWARVVMQLGAAGVVCLLLILAQMNMQSLLREIRNDQRDEVKQFRDELKYQRDADKESRQRQWQIIKENTDAIRQAIEGMKAAQTSIQRDVTAIRKTEADRFLPAAPPKIEPAKKPD